MFRKHGAEKGCYGKGLSVGNGVCRGTKVNGMD